MTPSTYTKKEHWPSLITTAVSLLHRGAETGDISTILLSLNVIDFTDWRELPDTFKDVKTALERFYGNWASGGNMAEMGSPQFKDFVALLYNDIQAADARWHQLP